jgi:hypothetical protein
MSKLIESRAAELVQRAVDELLKEAIMERLRERMGARLREAGRAAADMTADDVEANLAIEARIAERQQARRAAERPGPAVEGEAKTKEKPKPPRRGR